MKPKAKGQNGLGWLVFSVLGALNLFQGIVLIIFGGGAVQDSILNLTGLSWTQLEAASPNLAGYVEDLLMIQGLFLAGLGLLVLGIAVTGYRRKQAWAWYVMWMAPFFYLAAALILYAKGEIYFSDDLSFEFFALQMSLAFAAQLAEALAFRRASSTQTGLVGSAKS